MSALISYILIASVERFTVKKETKTECAGQTLLQLSTCRQTHYLALDLLLVYNVCTLLDRDMKY
jgi:hypothetical protein